MTNKYKHTKTGSVIVVESTGADFVSVIFEGSGKKMKYAKEKFESSFKAVGGGVKKKEKKVRSIVEIKCEDCKKSFGQSKFASNQKYCVECAKKHKRDRIKAKNKFKRHVASFKRLTEWAEKNKIEIKLDLDKLKDVSISEKYQMIKKHYPVYVEGVHIDGK